MRRVYDDSLLGHNIRWVVGVNAAVYILYPWQVTAIAQETYLIVESHLRSNEWRTWLLNNTVMVLTDLEFFAATSTRGPNTNKCTAYLLYIQSFKHTRIYTSVGVHMYIPHQSGTCRRTPQGWCTHAHTYPYIYLNGNPNPNPTIRNPTHTVVACGRVASCCLFWQDFTFVRLLCSERGFRGIRNWIVVTWLFQPPTTTRILVCLVVKQMILFTMLTVPA